MRGWGQPTGREESQGSEPRRIKGPLGAGLGGGGDPGAGGRESERGLRVLCGVLSAAVPRVPRVLGSLGSPTALPGGRGGGGVSGRVAVSSWVPRRVREGVPCLPSARAPQKPGRLVRPQGCSHV